jgi:hypothetical protein
MNPESALPDAPTMPSRRGRFGAALARLTDPLFVFAIVAPLVAALVTLLLVIPTLLPGVANWDTAEFQTVGPVLGTAHPTGYPAYVMLGWIASIVFQPFGEPAYTMNLLQAVTAAVAVAGTAGIVQLLTGRRWIALATGVLLGTSQLFWRLATHADPHMFHLALVAILFLLLLAWDRRRHDGDADVVRHADRWLVAAALVYGVAVANHSLALLLPPAIGLFVLAVDWRVVLRWRTVVACIGVLAATLGVLFLELPIRAAMHAPLVYGHPDTWSGFTYVVMAEQFRGSLVDPLGNLGTKAGDVFNLISGWLGPIGILAVIGLGTSLVRRPRYVLLSGLAVLVACFFAASYENADIERYYLVPLFVAYTWVGLGAADVVSSIVWLAARLRPSAAPDEAAEPDPGNAGATGATGAEARPVGWSDTVMVIAEAIVAVALLVGPLNVVSERQQPQSDSNPGGVSEALMTDDATWLRAVLAPADGGGLPRNSVIVSWWSTSTTLWYGQRVLGLRPDIYIVDDRTRLDDNLGNVQDVFNKFLGNRPVFTIRLENGVDGMAALENEYDIQPVTLGTGVSIDQVISRTR